RLERGSQLVLDLPAGHRFGNHAPLEPEPSNLLYLAGNLRDGSGEGRRRQGRGRRRRWTGLAQRVGLRSGGGRRPRTGESRGRRFPWFPSPGARGDQSDRGRDDRCAPKGSHRRRPRTSAVTVQAHAPAEYPIEIQAARAFVVIWAATTAAAAPRSSMKPAANMPMAVTRNAGRPPAGGKGASSWGVGA